MTQAFSDDPDLIRQLARGNEAAFSTIYARYQSPIYRFAWHMSGDAAMAEDVTQEVFVHLIERPKQYDPARGPVLNYLLGISRNLVRRRLQQTSSLVPIDDDLADGDPSAPVDLDFAAELDRRSLLDSLRTAVLALPEQYREAVVLCDIEEMSYPEAGQIMNCPPGTVASRLHRARSMLKARLQGMGCAR